MTNIKKVLMALILGATLGTAQAQTKDKEQAELEVGESYYVKSLSGIFACVDKDKVDPLYINFSKTPNMYILMERNPAMLHVLTKHAKKCMYMAQWIVADITSADVTEIDGHLVRVVIRQDGIGGQPMQVWMHSLALMEK